MTTPATDPLDLAAVLAKLKQLRLVSSMGDFHATDVAIDDAIAMIEPHVTPKPEPEAPDEWMAGLSVRLDRYSNSVFSSTVIGSYPTGATGAREEVMRYVRDYRAATRDRPRITDAEIEEFMAIPQWGGVHTLKIRNFAAWLNDRGRGG